MFQNEYLPVFRVKSTVFGFVMPNVSIMLFNFCPGVILFAFLPFKTEKKMSKVGTGKGTYTRHQKPNGEKYIEHFTT